MQTLKNLTAVLTAGGASLSSVLKVTIFLIDMAHFDAVNAIYQQHFPSPKPARTCIRRIPTATRRSHRDRSHCGAGGQVDSDGQLSSALRAMSRP